LSGLLLSCLSLGWGCGEGLSPDLQIEFQWPVHVLHRGLMIPSWGIYVFKKLEECVVNGTEDVVRRIALEDVSTLKAGLYGRYPYS
jgi:hypothetical protein